MNPKDALKWAAMYRFGAFGAFIVGIGLVGVGVLLGFGDALELLLEDPLNPEPALEEANPIIAGFFTILGLLVWQLGSAAIFYYTLVTATQRSTEDVIDPVRLKSEILDGLEDRLDVAEEGEAVSFEDSEGSGGPVPSEDPIPEATPPGAPAAEPTPAADSEGTPADEEDAEST